MISECVGLFGLYYFLIGVEFMLHYIFLAVILLAMLVSRVILLNSMVLLLLGPYRALSLTLCTRHVAAG